MTLTTTNSPAKNAIPKSVLIISGRVPDKVALQLTTKGPVTPALSDAVKTDQATNVFTMQATQTLTFPAANGATCSATDQRTLTNADSSGNPSTKTNSNGSNYTLTVSPTHPKVTEVK